MTDIRSESEEARRVVAELADRLCNWDRWARDDGLGALNLVTEGKRLEAAACIRSGAAISLGFELRPDLPQPPGSGRMNPQHVMIELPSDGPPALAEACAAAGRYEFFLSGAPLPLRGGVGGPVNPMAVL